MINAICTKGPKSNHLTFTGAGTSCGSHRHNEHHWTHFRSGGPFYVVVYLNGMNGKRGELDRREGPFNAGEKFFVDKDLYHEVIAEGPGEADCVFENDSSEKME